jgi:WD40 repeat protein
MKVFEVILTCFLILSAHFLIAETSNSNDFLNILKNKDISASSCLNKYLIKSVKVLDRLHCIGACKMNILCQTMVVTENMICKLYSSSPLQTDFIDSPGSNVFMSQLPQIKVTLSSCNGGHATGLPVTSLASLGSTSSWFVSVSHDAKVKIWDASTGVLVKNIIPQVSSIWMIAAISLGNNLFATGDRVGLVLVWNATTGIFF